MLRNEPVAAYAVYRNLVNVNVKNVPKLKKNRKNRKKQKKARPVENYGLPVNGRYVDVSRASGNVVNRATTSNGNADQSNQRQLNQHSLNIKKVQAHVMKGIRIKVKKNVKKALLSKSHSNEPLATYSDPVGSFMESVESYSEPVESYCESVENYQFPEGSSGNSFIDARKAFSWLIHPISPDEFFRSAWEQRPLHIKRRLKSFYSSLLSTKAIDKMLREHTVLYTKNLDITSYKDGKRETHNPEGRAYPSVVWDYYEQGNSIRLLNPQTFIDKIWQLNSALQDTFGCFVGANVYLTPPDSQGFAPHYDDIEAFILQVEGKKHWKLYAPLSPNEILPRFSSENFTQDAVGDPILDVVLEPGDLLYFPRGIIHQASTLPGAHSLHITISCYQKNTWGDLFEKMIPVALKIAIDEDPEFRRGLPPNYLRYMGVAHCDYDCEGRNKFLSKVSELMKRVCDHAPIDAAADQMGKQFMYDALPPYLSPEEASCTVLDGGEEMCDGVVTNKVEFNPDVRVKLVRGNVCRLVTEEDSVRIYHCAENSREYHSLEEPLYVEISAELAPAVEFLIHSYPAYVSVDDFPIDSETDKIQLAFDLWEKGLIMTERPLEADDSD